MLFSTSRKPSCSKFRSEAFIYEECQQHAVHRPVGGIFPSTRVNRCS